MLNQIQPIETVAFQLIVALFIVAILIVSVLIFRVLLNRIYKIEKDTFFYDELQKLHVKLYDLTIAHEASVRFIDSHQGKLNDIQRELYKPLYSIGNYIEYNRGINSSGGMHTFESGRITDVYSRTNAEAGYMVTGTEGENVEVKQSDITAWSE